MIEGNSSAVRKTLSTYQHPEAYICEHAYLAGMVDLNDSSGMRSSNNLNRREFVTTMIILTFDRSMYTLSIRGQRHSYGTKMIHESWNRRYFKHRLSFVFQYRRLTSAGPAVL